MVAAGVEDGLIFLAGVGASMLYLLLLQRKADDMGTVGGSKAFGGGVRTPGQCCHARPKGLASSTLRYRINTRRRGCLAD
jgi:hypothetical protein